MIRAALLPLVSAVEQLIESAQRPVGQTPIPLHDALGRVTADDQHAVLDVPPADNSAMDGYAVWHKDAGQTLPVTRRIAAGDTALPLSRGAAARIFTGAELPEGADSVVMQEDMHVADDGVRLPSAITPGQHVRRQGQDCRSGDLLLSAGRKLLPQDLGLLASQGFTSVDVFPRLRVALLSTGSELREPGSGDLPRGAIYNSNRPMLASLLCSLNIEVVDLGIVTDSRDATHEALQAAAGQADVILSSGGVSVGEEDHVKDVVRELGELMLWKVAIKPGKPFAHGRVGTTPFLGLPGNPASAFVTFVLLARPFLLAMQGRQDLAPVTYSAVADFEVDAAGSRTEYLRAVTRHAQGVVRAVPYHNQSSGVLRSLSCSNALAVIPAGTRINLGDTIDVLPLQDLLS